MFWVVAAQSRWSPIPGSGPGQWEAATCPWVLDLVAVHTCSLLPLNSTARPQVVCGPLSRELGLAFSILPLEGLGLHWRPTPCGFLPLVTVPLKVAEAFPVLGRVRLMDCWPSSPYQAHLSLGQAWKARGVGASFQFRPGAGEKAGLRWYCRGHSDTMSGQMLPTSLAL